MDVGEREEKERGNRRPNNTCRGRRRNILGKVTGKKRKKKRKEKTNDTRKGVMVTVRK